jgi:hypothetical protein
MKLVVTKFLVGKHSPSFLCGKQKILIFKFWDNYLILHNKVTPEEHLEKLCGSHSGNSRLGCFNPNLSAQTIVQNKM